jgi:hypothetical protein
MEMLMDRFSGTWEANHSESELDPNHRFRQATLHIEVTGEAFSVRAEGVGPDGEPCVEESTIRVDGAEHPVASVPGLTARGFRSDPNTIEAEAKQGERLVGKAQYRLSADGRKLIASNSGIDSKGREFTTRVVFDRV